MKMQVLCMFLFFYFKEGINIMNVVVFGCMDVFIRLKEVLSEVKIYCVYFLLFVIKEYQIILILFFFLKYKIFIFFFLSCLFVIVLYIMQKFFKKLKFQQYFKLYDKRLVVCGLKFKFQINVIGIKRNIRLRLLCFFLLGSERNYCIFVVLELGKDVVIFCICVYFFFNGFLIKSSDFFNKVLLNVVVYIICVFVDSCFFCNFLLLNGCIWVV